MDAGDEVLSSFDFISSPAEADVHTRKAPRWKVDKKNVRIVACILLLVLALCLGLILGLPRKSADAPSVRPTPALPATNAPNTSHPPTDLSPTIAPNVLPADAKSMYAPGVIAHYYTTLPNPNQIPIWNEQYLTRTTVSNISFPQSWDFFANSMRDHNVGAIFEGFLTFTSPGMWQISLTSDDGSRMFLWQIDSYPRIFISNDFTHAMRTRSGTVAVEPSQLTYAFVVEFFQAGGPHGCILSWMPPGGTLEFIPSSAFTHPADRHVSLPSVPSAAVGISSGAHESEAHSCFIAIDQSLWCHGTNSYGQLSLASLSSEARLEPFKTAISNVSEVALGGQHSCVTNATGVLMCWGGNKIGQIGNGFLSASVPLPTVPSFPQLTPPVARIVSFSLGYYHTCAIDAHSRMFCWGDGGFGRLGPNCSMGDDDFNWISGSHAAVGFESTDEYAATGISCNNQKSFSFLTSEKSFAGSFSLRCAPPDINTGPAIVVKFQLNTNYFPSSKIVFSIRVTSDSAASFIVKNTATWISALATIECYSSDTAVFTCTSTDELIVSSTTFSISDSSGMRNLIPGHGRMSVRIASLAISSCSASAFQVNALRLDTNAFFQTGREVWFFGNLFGGVNSQTRYYIFNVSGTTISISSSENGALKALLPTGPGSAPLLIRGAFEEESWNTIDVKNVKWTHLVDTLDWPPSKCRNCNLVFLEYRLSAPSEKVLYIDEARVSQIERCAFESSKIPTPVADVRIAGNLTAMLWRKVSLGMDHSCATDASSTLYCWGRNDWGQVGDGSGIDVSRPRPVANLGAPVSSFCAGYYHTCAAHAGSVYCWGAYAIASCVGNNDKECLISQSLSPEKQGNFTIPIIQVACGYSHTCALDSAGSVWCFGRNHKGQLGTFSGSSSQSFARVALSQPASLLAIGSTSHTSCVITVQQQRLCWGENSVGQYGDGSKVGRYQPVSGVPALLSIEPSEIFFISSGTQVTIMGSNSFGVSPYTSCSRVELRTQTIPQSTFFSFACSWLDPSRISATFVGPSNVTHDIADIPIFDVLLEIRGYLFSGLSVSVLLRIDSVSPSLVVQSGAALLIIVSSKEFRRVAPSNDELCYNAFVGNLSAPSCHWHAASGTVRLQLSAACALSTAAKTCSASVSFILSNRKFRSSASANASQIIFSSPDLPPALAKVDDVDNTVGLTVGFVCGSIFLLGGGWFYLRHKRAKSIHDVARILSKLRETVASAHPSSLKELNDLDHDIKLYLANSDCCARVCNVILDIVSDRIVNLSAVPQHLWCLLISCNLTQEGLDKLNAFLDCDRHACRARCVSFSASECILLLRALAIHAFPPRYLAHDCSDMQGRIAIQIASKTCRECLEARFLFMSRFDLNFEKSQYISATSRVVTASEKRTSEVSAETIVRSVALKFMKNKDQYEREIESRLFFKHLDTMNNHVIGIHYTYTQQDDKIYSDALANPYFHNFKDYPFLIVMPLADCDLKTIIIGENMAARAAEDFSQVKPIMQALLTSVLLLHDAGIVHGDIKPRNIMRTGGVGSFMYRLIDFDASACLPPPTGPDPPPKFCNRFVGSKSSTMYSPPELFYVENGKARVKDFHVTPNGECVADGPYEPVQASIAHDMWSLGAVLYELLTNETLFHGNSASDNMNSDEFLTLAEWSDDIKAKKLSKVPNLSFIREASCRYSLFEDGTSRGTTFRQPNFARNLLSILLMRDPAARPRSISHVLEHPLFRDGKSPGRLVGEKAKYDFFLSYRVAAKVDAELLSDIWTQLTQRGYRVFWDKQDLHKGREWEKEFCEGLVCSHVFVPLLSQAAVKNPDNPRANFEMLKEESDCDNVLLEHRLALELKDRGFVQSIMPLLIGQCNNGTIDKFQFSQLPAAAQLPKVQVWALEAKLREHLGNHCMGTPYDETATVHDVFKRITAFQGHKVEGPKEEAVLAVVRELELLRNSNLHL